MAVLTAAALAATLAVAAAAAVAGRLSGRGPALCPAPRPGPAEQRPPAPLGRWRRWAALGRGAVLGVWRSLRPFQRRRGRFGGSWWRRRGGPPGLHRRVALPGGGGARGGAAGGAGGWGPGEASCAGAPRPPAPEPWGDDAGAFGGSSASGSPGGSGGEDDARLLECIVKDLKAWESSGQWIFSCYGPWRGKPNVLGFTDLSPEEMRLGYYNCRANNDIQSYLTAVHQLIEQWNNRVRQIKAFYAAKKMALLSQLRNVAAQLCVPLDFKEDEPEALDCVIIV